MFRHVPQKAGTAPVHVLKQEVSLEQVGRWSHNETYGQETANRQPVQLVEQHHVWQAVPDKASI